MLHPIVEDRMRSFLHVPVATMFFNSAEETESGHGDHKSQKEDLKYEHPVACEISALISYDGEGLEDYVKDKKFVPPVLLSSPEEEPIFQNGTTRKD
ncbi:hypothetical protein HPB52_019470 [Rhipicephalus sanguineus]|uniref:Uncharacterized protein n=1 Tax=Rhipicephalus sanguineus TaxID=34632 RepID=A0A9D4PCC9_RHISA|nr:hypothetical protein HPB52_019470 [Rhipicephalus sanguineus]